MREKMTLTKKIISQINELNNELEKMRPEFEEIWNKEIIQNTQKWVTMEEFITQMLETSVVLPRTSIGEQLAEENFPSLFDGYRILSPHTKRTIQPYLRWLFKQIYLVSR